MVYHFLKIATTRCMIITTLEGCGIICPRKSQPDVFVLNHAITFGTDSLEKKRVFTFLHSRSIRQIALVVISMCFRVNSLPVLGQLKITFYLPANTLHLKLGICNISQAYIFNSSTIRLRHSHNVMTILNIRK